MTEQDIRTAFGETPASFRDQVDRTLTQLEDEPAKKRYKFTTVLALAALITVLLAGPTMQLIFKLHKFDVQTLKPETIPETLGKFRKALSK